MRFQSLPVSCLLVVSVLPTVCACRLVPQRMGTVWSPDETTICFVSASTWPVGQPAVQLLDVETTANVQQVRAVHMPSQHQSRPCLPESQSDILQVKLGWCAKRGYRAARPMHPVSCWSADSERALTVVLAKRGCILVVASRTNAVTRLVRVSSADNGHCVLQL